MTIKLPPSLDRNRYSIEDKVAFARSLTPEQRLVVLARVCETSMKLLALNPKREQLLEMRDPLPASTVAALKRLRGPRVSPAPDS